MSPLAILLALAAIIVDRGLQVIVGRTSGTADSFTKWTSMSVDDGADAFTATDTALDATSTPTNMVVNDFDSTPTRSSQTVTHLMTVAKGEANFTIKRIAIHNDVQGNVTKTSNTLCAGIDGQSLTKTSDFSMEFQVDHTQTDNS